MIEALQDTEQGQRMKYKTIFERCHNIIQDRVGHAKQALFDLICKQFSDERERYNHYMANPEEIAQALALGAEKAKAVANKVLSRVRGKLGY